MGPSNISIDPIARNYLGPTRILTPPFSTRGAVSTSRKSCPSCNKCSHFPPCWRVLLVGAVFVSGRKFLVDPDIWWHIKVGDTILNTHRWPTTDVYSFTVSGQPWFAYEWLGEVVLALANRIGGVRGLETLLIALGSAIMLALYGLATARSGNSKAGFAASSVLLVLATASFSLRPQMLGYLFLILTLLALERFRQGKPKSLWFIPVMMLLWVNTHGSWIIGLGAVLVYWISGLVEFRAGDLDTRRWTKKERIGISWVFLLSVAALPITPYGTRIALSPFEYAFSLPLNATSIVKMAVNALRHGYGRVWFCLLGTIINYCD